MAYFRAFAVGLIFSFLGSIPPGSLNLCVLQLGLEGKISIAIRFALAVAVIEYPYTWIAIEFEQWVTSSPMVTQNFQLITAIVMTTLGIFTLLQPTNSIGLARKVDASGFRRGLVLSILNPMAIPFWIAVTAYLKSQHWINISTPGLAHSYIFGTAVGVLMLLGIFILLARRLSPHVKNSNLVKQIPGATLIALGLYAFSKYVLS